MQLQTISQKYIYFLPCFQDSIDCGDSEQFYNIVPFGEEDAPAFGDVL